MPKGEMKENNFSHRSTLFGLRLDFFICLVLIIIILSAYLQVTDHQFVYDDVSYITDNPHIQKGLTLENIAWSFTANVAANWHPMTLLSHMIDCQLYGLNPAGHHVTSLLFHIANTLLLFLVLKSMTNTLWQSAFVAALFAVHPLHVESVAWVSERKDVLSTFFWMLTMWSYTWYTRRPGIKRYMPVLFFLVLGLMSKPMLVTLPFVLLLLDYWPLKRFHFGRPGWWRLLLEKIPLFAVVAASCILTILFQKSGGAVISLETYPFYPRLLNAFVSYTNYIINMLWPFKLAAFYPYSKHIPLWHVVGSCLFLLSMTFIAINNRKQHEYVVVGWFWYLGTLIPVIGLVQVGLQSMADRYTYVPLIGIFIIIAWGVPELLSRFQHKQKALAITAIWILLILIVTSFIQGRYWKNNISLFEHAIRVTTGNYFAHNSLGAAFAKQDKINDATMHFSKSLQISPTYVQALNNLGAVLLKQHNYVESVRHLSLALRVCPGYAMAHNNMGVAMERQGKISEAFNHYSEAVRLNPWYSAARKNLDAALLKQKRFIESGKNISELTEAHLNSKTASPNHKYFEKVIKKIEAQLTSNPDSAKAHFMLGNILLAKGKVKEAAIRFQEALRLDNNFSDAHINLGYALYKQDRKDEAIKHCLEAIRLNPDSSIDAYYNLACIYAVNNKTEESVCWLKQAVDKGFNDWNLLISDNDLENIRKTEYFINITQAQKHHLLKVKD